MPKLFVRQGTNSSRTGAPAGTSPEQEKAAGRLGQATPTVNPGKVSAHPHFRPERLVG